MATPQLSNFNVLIVDDEKQIQRLVYDVLASLGFRNIVVASSGRRAMELMDQQKFDFIITDWRMQDLDGIEIVRYARQMVDSKHMTTPIIMLTGNTEPHYVITARDAGANGYVLKPFSATQLVKRIRVVIENPVPFILAPKYHGPDRRRKNMPPPGGIERRKPIKS